MYICYMYVICDIYVCLIKVSAAHCVIVNTQIAVITVDITIDTTHHICSLAIVTHDHVH